MSEPEQVEAVARAITPYVHDPDEIRKVAKIAIATYEATRPAVSDDLTFDDLNAAYWYAFNRESIAISSGRSVPATPEELRDERRIANASGIRAVRERLDPTP